MGNKKGKKRDGTAAGRFFLADRRAAKIGLVRASLPRPGVSGGGPTEGSPVASRKSGFSWRYQVFRSGLFGTPGAVKRGTGPDWQSTRRLPGKTCLGVLLLFCPTAPQGIRGSKPGGRTSAKAPVWPEPGARGAALEVTGTKRPSRLIRVRSVPRRLSFVCRTRNGTGTPTRRLLALAVWLGGGRSVPRPPKNRGTKQQGRAGRGERGGGGRREGGDGPATIGRKIVCLGAAQFCLLGSKNLTAVGTRQ